MSFKSYFQSKNGATAVEYALIALAIALVIAVTLYAFGTDLTTLFYERLPAVLDVK